MLINGRHHVLWEELSTNRWVVTTPERRTSVVSLQTASVVSLGRGDLFPGPGRPFLALSLLSSEDWDTHRSAARSLVQFLSPQPRELPGYTPVGQAWRRLREDEDFLYDHSSPCPELPGYAVDLVLRGHEFCRCQLSGWVKWFLPHSVDRSAWPWSFRRVEAYVQDLLRFQPDYVAMGYSSYGYVVTVDMYERQSFWRTPSLDRRVALRLRELAEVAAAAGLRTTAERASDAHLFDTLTRAPAQSRHEASRSPTPMQVAPLAMEPFSDHTSDNSDQNGEGFPATVSAPTWVGGVALAQARARAMADAAAAANAGFGS